MKKLLSVLSILAVFGVLFASAQPAEARHHRHHGWHHSMKKHPGVMRMHHCHWMNKRVWSKRWQTYTWKQVRVCTR